VKLLLAIPFLALVPFAILAQDQPAGTWLHSAPVQWNRPGASIPLPAVVGPGRPQDVEKNITPEYCKAQQRSVRLCEERVVAGAGCLVFTSLQNNDSLNGHEAAPLV
jgi:hypothetical protein